MAQPNWTALGSAEDIEERFRYHQPTSEDTVAAHTAVRVACAEAAGVLNTAIPVACREKALALTKLEEAMFWANAAIARNHQGK